MRLSPLRAWAATLVLAPALASPALAVDGVIEINHASALAGGVTTGDGTGYPVTLSARGSYRLTSNLTVPDENTNGIEITTDEVSLDLNGFAILGPVACSGSPPTSCAPAGTGQGIRSVNILGNYKVVNGFVRGMGRHGVYLPNGRVHVEGVAVSHNGNTGIEVHSCVMVHNVARLNLGAGLRCTRGTVAGNVASFNAGSGIISGAVGVISDNTVESNGSNGIFANQATISNNVVRSNGDDGIYSNGGTVRGNAISGNAGDGLQIGGGTVVGYGENVIHGNGGTVLNGPIQIGTNICDGNTTCP